MKNYIIHMNISKKTKYLKRPYETDTDSETDNTLNTWPRFLIIESTDDSNPISKWSPFAIQKGIEGLAGCPKSAKTLRSGALLVEVSKEAHSKALLSAKTLVQSPIKVYPHKSLNTCRGVIRCPELKYSPDEEILENLASQGVTDIRRITVMREGQRKATGTFILTFNGSHLPSTLKAGYLSVKVNTYIPNPMRCFKCQKYGHFSSNCNHAEICEKCAQPKHTDNCTENICCINCKGDHAASSRDCPMWKQEKEIQAIKVKNNIPYFEAKKLLTLRTPQNGTYAAKLISSAKKTCTISTQTSLTWLERDTPKDSVLESSQEASTSMPTLSTPVSTQTVNQNRDPKQKNKPESSQIPTAGGKGGALKPKPVAKPTVTPKPPTAVKPKATIHGQKPSKGSGILQQNKFSSLQDLQDMEEMDIVPNSIPSSPPKTKPIAKIKFKS